MERKDSTAPRRALLSLLHSLVAAVLLRAVLLPPLAAAATTCAAPPRATPRPPPAPAQDSGTAAAVLSAGTEIGRDEGGSEGRRRKGEIREEAGGTACVLGREMSEAEK